MSPSKTHPMLPPDYTPEEYKLLMFSVVNVYQRLEDPIDKFIVAMVYEMGYNANIAAMSLGISSPAVTMRIKKIKRILEDPQLKNPITQVT